MPHVPPGADRPNSPRVTYFAKVVVIGSLTATLAWLDGWSDVRALCPEAATSLVMLTFALFWPAFYLSLSRLEERRYHRALGAPLHGLASLLLMAAQFGKPTFLAGLHGALPLLAIAMLAGWLILETGQLHRLWAAARYLWSRIVEGAPAGATV